MKKLFALILLLVTFNAAAEATSSNDAGDLTAGLKVGVGLGVNLSSFNTQPTIEDIWLGPRFGGEAYLIWGLYRYFAVQAGLAYGYLTASNYLVDNDASFNMHSFSLGVLAMLRAYLGDIHLYIAGGISLGYSYANMQHYNATETNYRNFSFNLVSEIGLTNIPLGPNGSLLFALRSELEPLHRNQNILGFMYEIVGLRIGYGWRFN
ncbi:MAG: PorT family protein [Spirochaetaceae bacterium]|nr:PorT family protein [Spirochaetaceae bacterium]